MIDLTLARIGRLLALRPAQTWKGIHVAGTNGKGSICADISALLHASGRTCGRFTSPHLMDRWDCITINQKPVSEKLFLEAESDVKQRDRDGGIGASEFELLTATAFEIFERTKVEWGVVEAGMGGRLDATNAMSPADKHVAVIGKIGLDHQAFLGNTVVEIAREKAGIFTHSQVAVVLDPTNPPKVLAVLREHAMKASVKDIHAPTGSSPLCELMAEEGWEPHQVMNLAIAEAACTAACGPLMAGFDACVLAIRQLEWPGRLQMLDLGPVTGRQEKVLLDGAHNPQSAEVLATYVGKHMRTEGVPVTWVLAATEAKDVHGILRVLLRPGDRATAVRFEPVAGMPWVKPMDPSDLLSVATRHGVPESQQHDSGDDVRAALTWASREADTGPVVVAGSLYLVSSVLRLLRAAS